MMRLLIAAFLTLLASLTQAQTLVVRSGEHDQFTRLVIPQVGATNWKVTYTPTGAQVSLDAEGVTLDLSQVFERVPRTRLDGLGYDPERQMLTMALNCACPIAAFVYKGSYLVLDVQNGEQRQPQILAETQYRFQGLSPVGSPFDRLSRRSPEVEGRDEKVEEVKNPIGNFRALPIQPLSGGGMPPEVGLALDSTDPMQELLRQEVLDAAAQGMVQLPKPMDTQSQTALPLVQATPAMANSEVSAATLLSNHVRTRTSRQGRTSPPQLNSQTCIPDMVFWPDTSTLDGRFSADIGRLNRQRADSPDDVAALRETAKTLLYYGFGAEAKTLAAILPRADERDLLMALADVIDHGYAPGSNVLTGQTSCDGLIALWSYLASHTPSASGAESDLSKVIHALSTLPAPLRAHVGPMLVERLIQADQADYADQVLRIMTGSPSDRKDPAQVATAMVAAGQGDPDHARRTAEQVIEDQAPEAASAFPVLVEAAFDQRSPLQEAQIDLLRSYVVEHRGTQLGEKLEKALILALGLQRQFGDAVQGLLALDPLPAELASQLAQVLTEAGTDIDFLRYALATDNPWQGLPGNPALLAMGERLIDLGFPTEARNLAIASQDGRVERDRRLMRARAALDMRNPAWALRDLKGLTGPDADPLRAKAYEQSDSLDDASLLYARLGDTENVDRLAWQRHSDDGWRTASPDVADSPDKEEGLRPADQKSATLTATAPPQDGVGRADTPPAEIPPIDAPRDPLSDSGADPSLETRYGALIDAARNLSQAVPAAESLDISAALARDLKTNSAQTRALVEQLLSRATAADVLE